MYQTSRESPGRTPVHPSPSPQSLTPAGLSSPTTAQHPPERTEARGSAPPRVAEMYGHHATPPPSPDLPRQAAALAGVDPEKVEEWRGDHTFPLPVVERSPGPLFVREDVERWLEKKGLLE